MEGTLYEYLHIYDNISPNSAQSEKYFRQKVYRKSKHTFYVQKLFTENLVVYEIIWKIMVDPDRP
jgi:hypothetical protein